MDVDKKKKKADYQREYRKRLKEKNEETYLQNERKRKQKSYTKSSELNKRDLERRRKYNRERMKLYRARKKELNQRSPVKLDTSKRKSTRKRISRATSRANRKINKLEKQLVSSNRKIWKLKKRLQKLKSLQINQNVTNPSELVEKRVTSTSSPLSAAKADMQESGLNPTKYKNICRKLQFHHVLVDEMKSVKPDLVKRIVSGKIAKKYQMVSYTSRVFNIRRKALLNESKELKKTLRKRMPLIQEQIKEEVLKFFNRGDNSSVMPGKSDYKTVNGKQNQKRILSDHLKNLYMKFRTEQLDIQLSYSRFCKYRPPHFSLVSYATRNTCLCIKHQNMALKIRCLHKAGLSKTESPDVFVQDITDNFDFNRFFPLDSGPFEYQEWTRVNTDAGQRMNIVTKTCERGQFLTSFKKQCFEFKDHVERVKNQYRALQDPKANLPHHHFIVQMDFAENFNCKTSDEVQSSYYNKCLVSLHPVVVYHKINGVLHHKNYTFISNDLNHNATFVFSVMSRLMPLLKGVDSDAACIHYWTDSPTSQYRNKHIFSIVKNHMTHFGVDCTWDYFEAGHGKGPCDGIGGTAKRCADLAIKQRKVNIQSAADFHTWAANSNLAVSFKYISKDDINRYGIVLNESLAKNCKPLKGTLKLHSVRMHGSSLFSRNTSCYCQNCLEGEFCDGWSISN